MRFRTALVLVFTLAVTVAAATLQGAATASRQQADSIIERFERDATVRFAVLRDEALLEFSLAAPTSAEPPSAEPAEKE